MRVCLHVCKEYNRTVLCCAEEDDTQACKFTEKVMHAQNAGAQGVSDQLRLCYPSRTTVLHDEGQDACMMSYPLPLETTLHFASL